MAKSNYNFEYVEDSSNINHVSAAQKETSIEESTLNSYISIVETDFEPK